MGNTELLATAPADDFKRAETTGCCRLFGIELFYHSLSAPSVEQVFLQPSGLSRCSNEVSIQTTYSDFQPILIKPAYEKRQSQVHIPLLKETKVKQSGASSTRSCTKVHMQGVAVGRAVDLTTLEGYDQLIRELEEMFDIKGQLRPRDKWEIIFTDDDGDMMLVGDDPWPEFCNMVRMIFICSSQDVKKMGTAGSKVPLSSAEVETTMISSDSAN